MRDFCIGMISSRWQAKGADVCGAGGLKLSDEHKPPLKKGGASPLHFIAAGIEDDFHELIPVPYTNFV